MVARIKTAALQGVEVLEIDVEVQISNGLPAFQIVGLPDKAVGESRERVRAALTAIGLALPMQRITVNLAPADVLKEGSHFDLPIAAGLLTAMGILPAEEIAEWSFMGELGLDGRLVAVAGMLPVAMDCLARDRGLVCPAASGPEAAWAGEDVDILAPQSLMQMINHFKGQQLLSRPARGAMGDMAQVADLADIKGQESAKRALEIAAAGNHNLLLSGPPGAGKSMLAARLPGILPAMSAMEALEVSMIQSVAGMTENGVMSMTRPFRDPHHNVSQAAMVGGGSRARPGEISLAHNGVLFLDELPEFGRQVLEALRQPMETGKTIVARANHHITWPSRFQLVAAMNPCKCGYLGDPEQACNRAPGCAQPYQARISGPMFDRIDLHIDVPAVSALDLTLPPPAEGSAEVANRVEAARALQTERLRAHQRTDLRSNADLEGSLLETMARPDEASRQLLQQAAEKMRLSARGYHRVLKVARTLADLEQSESLKRRHIAEALSYRRQPAQARNRAA